MPCLVVRGSAAVLRRDHDLALGAEDDLLERLREVRGKDLRLAESRGQQRRLVHEVRKVGANHAGWRRGDPLEVDVRGERDVARVHLEDEAASLPVRGLHHDAAIETARPQQRLIEHIDAVRRADHDHGRGRVEAVHLGEDLVQRLLPLVAAAEAAAGAAARSPDGVELVDEDDRRRLLLRLPEEVADTGGAYADDRLDELGGRHREEGGACLAGDGSREQRLAGAG